jgi:hypothetical protein
MPAITTAAITSGAIAFAKWLKKRKEDKSAKKVAENTFNENERQAYLQRQVLSQIIKERGLAEKFGLSEDTLLKLVGQPRKYTGQTGQPGGYADLAGELLGASLAYQRAPKAAETGYGTGTMPPDFGPDSDFGPTLSAGGTNRLVPCPDGWVENDSVPGGCAPVPTSTPMGG